MNTYTDPALLDVAGALDALPALPLDGSKPQGEAARATGTDNLPLRENNLVAPPVAPTWCNGRFTGQSLRFASGGYCPSFDGAG
jgi:hypothetical protein